jgi:hypothetical protein
LSLFSQTEKSKGIPVIERDKREEESWERSRLLKKLKVITLNDRKGKKTEELLIP